MGIANGIGNGPSSQVLNTVGPLEEGINLTLHKADPQTLIFKNRLLFLCETVKNGVEGALKIQKQEDGISSV